MKKARGSSNSANCYEGFCLSDTVTHAVSGCLHFFAMLLATEAAMSCDCLLGRTSACYDYSRTAAAGAQAQATLHGTAALEPDNVEPAS